MHPLLQSILSLDILALLFAKLIDWDVLAIIHKKILAGGSCFLKFLVLC